MKTEEQKIIDKLRKNIDKKIDKEIKNFLSLPKTEPKLRGLIDYL